VTYLGLGRNETLQYHFLEFNITPVFMIPVILCFWLNLVYSDSNMDEFACQDFEALTPNILARTIETAEGGGMVVILLKTMTSFQQLYTMSMVFDDTSLLFHVS